MGYDEEFFEKYRNYLQEETVRRVHDGMFRTFFSFSQGRLPNLQNIIDAKPPIEVIDLGCGLCQEFKLYGWYNFYFGVDKMPVGGDYFEQADYLTYPITRSDNTFVSLFSTECCLSAEDKYAFYNKLFSENPNIRYGLVSGFYYKDRVEDKKVEEAGGLVSYQTIENPQNHRSKWFDEFRVYADVPSALFGPNVVEVWKFFNRRW